MNENLERKLANLPRQPGVYLMKDRTGRILYIGKAKRLDNRVRSYFTGIHDHPRHHALMSRLHDLDVIATDSDVDALILEMTLIKEKRPVYNINLKDDKRFPFVKVTVAEPYPKVFLTRRVKEDGSRYFGPYTDVRSLRQTLRTLRTLFPVRSCMGDRPGRGPQYRECLDYYIHRCMAPCIDRCTEDSYRQAVNDVCLFLGGDGDAVLARLNSEMADHSGREEYEAAARSRDRIGEVTRMMRRQKMVDVHKRDTDVLAFSRRGDHAHGVVLQVRDGRVLGKEKRLLKGVSERKDAEIVAAFLLQYYLRSDTIPPQVAVEAEPEDLDLILAWLESRAGRVVKLIVPRKGSLKSLVGVALNNARLDAEETPGGRKHGHIVPAVYELQAALGMKLPPVRIEGFDISNIQGAHPVASLVVALNGEPATGEYRRFRMKSPGPDDFAMMREVVTRRIRRIETGEFPVPDLIMVDGGIGQVGAALAAIAGTRLETVQVIGLAKRLEEIIIPGAAEPLRLPRNAPALRILIRLRDEAHRFAIRYHRSLRNKAALHSQLDDVEGIGEERRLSLLQYFGSFDAVVRATVVELAAAPGFGAVSAKRLFAALHPAAATGEGL